MRGTRGLEHAGRYKIIAAFMFVLLLAAQAGWAEAETSENPEEISTLLEWSPDAFSFTRSLPIDLGTVEFDHEPQYAGGDIVRGNISLQNDQERYVGFAWDRTAGLLYLDYDGDRDLTDDPGPYQAIDSGSHESTFENVRIRIDKDGRPVEYRTSMTLGGRWSVATEVTSGWRGVVSLDGQDYVIEIVDDFGGPLTAGLFDMRPVGEKTTREAIGERGAYPSRRRAPRGVPAQVAAANSTYTVRAEFGKSSEGVRMHFRALRGPLGELRFKGTHIKEAHILGKDNAAISYVSGNVIKASPGNYRVDWLVLEDGWLDGLGWLPLTVEEGQCVEVEAGGPLHPVVFFTGCGNRLILDFTAEDRYGHRYSSDSQSAKPQRFAILRGQSQVASGTFEYGERGSTRPYSWRVPLNIFGPLTIVSDVAGLPLFEEGPRKSYFWSPYWSLLRLAPWLVFLLAVAIAGSFTNGAWKIALPAPGLFVVTLLVDAYWPAAFDYVSYLMPMVYSLPFVWLMGRRLAQRRAAMAAFIAFFWLTTMGVLYIMFSTNVFNMPGLKPHGIYLLLGFFALAIMHTATGFLGIVGILVARSMCLPCFTWVRFHIALLLVTMLLMLLPAMMRVQVFEWGHSSAIGGLATFFATALAFYAALFPYLLIMQRTAVLREWFYGVLRLDQPSLREWGGGVGKREGAIN